MPLSLPTPDGPEATSLSTLGSSADLPDQLGSALQLHRSCLSVAAAATSQETPVAAVAAFRADCCRCLGAVGATRHGSHLPRSCLPPAASQQTAAASEEPTVRREGTDPSLRCVPGAVSCLLLFTATIFAFALPQSTLCW